jgi:hypothetical protein
LDTDVDGMQQLWSNMSYCGRHMLKTQKIDYFDGSNFTPILHILESGNNPQQYRGAQTWEQYMCYEMR